MFIVNLKRIIRSGFVGFWRNGFVSFSSVLVMVITLFVITSTMFLSALLGTALQEIKNKVDINVYFVRTAPEEDILALKKTLETLPEVKTPVEYISRDQALENFRKRNENDELTLQALDELGDNPLGAALNIRAKEPSQYEGIAEFLKSRGTLSKDGTNIIDKVNYYQNKTAIDALTRMINSANKLGFIITIVLLIISIIITYNTIRLAIFMSKDEIGVMRLVGASKMYIRGPFIVSGAMYGVVSALFVLIFFFPVTLYIGNMTEQFFLGLNLFTYYTHNFPQIFIIVLLSGIAIGSFSSFLAVRRHLKV
jgi:cell division transport system permease protein